MIATHFSLLAFAVAVVASLGAQVQTVTVPAQAELRDGSGVLDGASFGRAGRLQIVLGESHLAGAVGATLQALRLRRDGARFDLRPGAAVVTVSASASRMLDPDRPSPLFAANHSGSPTVLFQGTVVLAAAPGLTDRHAATWQVPDSVTIPFASPFLYAGGALCLQLDILPVSGNASSWWPIDAERSGPAGRASTRGQACGATAGLADRPASVDARTLRIGSTVVFSTLGIPSTTAVLVLGATTVGPIDLGFLGAPGCKLHVLPEATLTAPVSAAILPGRPGAANVAVPLPHEPRLLGARLHSQWLLAGAIGLTTTNALDLEVSPIATSLNASVVAGGATVPPLPDVGRVDASVVPVLQLDYRR